jgi:tetratricopeptide (TPR) repeat protein
MRAFVFTDRALARRAGQFVWLSIDTERPGNASFLTKYPVEAWPSFFVLDSDSGKAVLRWVGGATVGQVQKILEDGAAAVRGKGRGVEEILARADSLYGQGKNAEAVVQYRDALDRAPAKWPRCAVKLKAEDPARAQLVAALAADAREVLSSPRKDIAADDISSVYESLASEREAARDEEGKKRVLSERAVFLEGEAARAKSPDARAVFDSHRLETYLDLGEPERAVPMLEASERDLPDDYNPPARLAVAYKAGRRYDEALAASDRALSKAYGPRKVGILLTRADIYAAKGDRASARRTLEETLEYAQSLPAGQRSEKTIATVKKKLEAMP